MTYDDQLRKWKQSGSEQGGQSGVNIYKRNANPVTYRVVGRKGTEVNIGIHALLSIQCFVTVRIHCNHSMY